MISLSLPGSTAAPCCAIVGLISCGALILPVLAPRGRCAVTGEVSSGSRPTPLFTGVRGKEILRMSASYVSLSSYDSPGTGTRPRCCSRVRSSLTAHISATFPVHFPLADHNTPCVVLLEGCPVHPSQDALTQRYARRRRRKLSLRLSPCRLTPITTMESVHFSFCLDAEGAVSVRLTA